MFRDRAKITFYGSRKYQEIAKKAVEAIPGIETMPEPEARLKIQEVIDRESLKADISFDGNGVTSLVRIIRNLKQIMEAGALYKSYKPHYEAVGNCIILPVGKRNDIILSDYFYEFLSLSCGSIAHYDKCGWVACYPTLDDLKAFFKKNEFGATCPRWHTRLEDRCKTNSNSDRGSTFPV